MKNPRSFLVTGGTGFIGAALVKRLVKDGFKVRVLDNNWRGKVSKLGDTFKQVEFVEADIRNSEAVIQAAQGMDCFVHLAYVNGTEFFYSQPELVLDVAVRGMLNSLDACRKNGIKQYILASSSEVYQTPPTVPTDETVPLSIPDVMNPRYSYGGGKLICELMAINYGRTGFDRVMTFRPHNVYGPDMGWEHVLPQFILRAKEAVAKHPTGPVPFEIQGDGSQTRAFVHIDDFTDGIMTMVHKGSHLGLYHIGTSEELTIRQVAEAVLKAMDREVKIIPGPEPKGATPRRCPDISRLRGLGYSPKISFQEGIRPMVDWYLKNAHLREKK